MKKKIFVALLASSILATGSIPFTVNAFTINATAETTTSVAKKNEKLKGRGFSDYGREEPAYVNIIGYVVVDLFDSSLKNSDSCLNAQWTVPKYSKDGENYVENGNVPHKTEVVVKSQALEHEGYGAYSGYLYVEQLDNHEEYYIDVGNFITNPYWTYENLEEAVSAGCYLATYEQRSSHCPVLKDNESVILDNEITVLVLGKTGTYGNGPDKEIYPLEAVVFKEWTYGYGGVSVFFNPEDLTILY